MQARKSIGNNTVINQKMKKKNSFISVNKEITAEKSSYCHRDMLL